MFKLVKVLGSSTAPEPIRVGFDGAVPCVAGCIYYLTEGTLACSPQTDYDPLIFAIQSLPKNSEQKSVLCILLTPDMVFEANVDNVTDDVITGEHFLPSFTGNGEMRGINTNMEDDEESTIGTVIDASTYKSTGKVLVRFF